MAINVLLSVSVGYVAKQYFALSYFVCVGFLCPLLYIPLSISTILWTIFIAPRYSPFRHLPAPDQGPLKRRLFIEPGAEIHAKWINEVPNEGLIRYHGILNRERLMITHPDGVKQLLTLQPYHYIFSPGTINIVKRITGLGLMAAQQDEHKFQRKLLQPIFNHANIKQLYPVFWDESSRFIRILERRISQTIKGKDVACPIEISAPVSCATLDTFTRSAFGGSYNAMEEPDTQLVNCYKLLLDNKHFNWYLGWAIFIPYNLFKYLPMKLRYELDDTIKYTRDATRPFAQQCLEQDAGSRQNGLNMMSEMMKLGHRFTEEQIMDHIFTFLIAAQDTTAASTYLTLYRLSQNPEMQRKLREEIRSNLPCPTQFKTGQKTAAEPATLQDVPLDSLPYLTACVNEGIRLHAPVPYVRRQVFRQGAVILGHPLPVGTIVYASPMAINRSVNLWGPDANEFRPERWINPTTGKFDPLGGTNSPYACNSFGHGPRTCIGQKFGVAEAKSLVACLVGQFEWTYHGAGENGELAEPQYVTQSLTKVVGGLWLNAKKVEGWY